MNDSTPKDFDFIIGTWQVQHRRLNRRLCACDAWTEFTGTTETRRVLGGFGNLEDNYLALPDGAYHAIAFRSYDPATQQWSIWWLDGRFPHRLDPPVVGAFLGPIGTFYADDQLDGRPIRVRFIWNATNPERPLWEQAFSDDGGRQWETNWSMSFSRV